MENHGNWIGSFILFRDIKEQIFLILANVRVRYVALRVRNNILWRILKNPDEKLFQKSIEKFKKKKKVAHEATEPKKQKNRVKLHRRVLGNPSKNSKKNICQVVSHERLVKSPWKSLDVFDVLKLKLAHESHNRRSKKIVPHYVEEFLEILWRIRKKNCCQIISHERVVKSFEVETCAHVVRPKKQKNRVKLHHRILRNPSKNSKKK